MDVALVLDRALVLDAALVLVLDVALVLGRALVLDAALVPPQMLLLVSGAGLAFGGLTWLRTAERCNRTEKPRRTPTQIRVCLQNKQRNSNPDGGRPAARSARPGETAHVCSSVASVPPAFRWKTDVMFKVERFHFPQSCSMLDFSRPSLSFSVFFNGWQPGTAGRPVYHLDCYSGTLLWWNVPACCGHFLNKQKNQKKKPPFQ